MAVRLALGGDRVRLLVMSVGVGLAVALLLAVAGALPAAETRLEKVGARSVVLDDSPAARVDGIVADTTRGFWRDQPLGILRIEQLGRPVTPPPGVTRLPGPGEVLASPALADALADRPDELGPRIPGRVVGQIDPAGLVGPDELFVIVGVGPGMLDSTGVGSGFRLTGAPTVVEYRGGDVREYAEAPGDYLRVAAVLGGVALVVPLLLLVVTATRLSAASRERRTAAIRLLGATRRQLLTVGAVEGALVGVVGALLGGVLFLLLRPLAASLLPIPDGLYAADIQPGVAASVLVVLGVPALSATAGAFALRRAVAGPLGISRQAAPAPAGALRLAPLAVGLALLVAAYLGRDAVLEGARWALALILMGAAFCLLGTAVAGSALARLSGLALARWGRGPASQLAGRRLVMDPHASARATTGTALVVVVIGWVLAFLPLLAESNPSGTGELTAALRPSTVVASVNTRFTNPADLTAAAQRVRGVAGARGVVPIGFASLAPAGTRTEDDVPIANMVSAVVMNCGELAEVLQRQLSDCRPDTPMLLSSIYGRPSAAVGEPLRLLTPDGDSVPRPELTLPADLPTLTLPAGLQGGINGFVLQGDVVIPPDLLGNDVPVASLLIGTDAEPSTVEAVRAALGNLATDFAPVTAEESLNQARSESAGYARIGLIGILVVVLVGGLSLAVTTVDGLREGRRSQAALVALGTPVRLLRRAVLLQTAAPLLLSVGLAVMVTAVASWLYLQLISPSVPPGLPWAGYGLIGVAALAASLLATVLTLPFVRAATRPEALRTE